MALGQPTVTGADYLDFKDLVTRSSGPVFIFARNREFKAPETGTKRSERGPVLPVVADIFVATGPDAGQLHPMEEIIGAPTAALRGAKNPNNKNGWQILPPVNELNVTYPFIVSIKNNAGNDYVAFDVPKGAHWDQAAALYGQFGEEGIWVGKAAAPAAPVNEEASTPLGAGASKRPW